MEDQLQEIAKYGITGKGVARGALYWGRFHGV